MKKDARSILRQIKKKWNSLSKIQRIIITHSHYDHLGGLKTFLTKILKEKQTSNINEAVQIISHEDEKVDFEKTIKNKAIKITKTIKHEEYIDEELGLKAIHTPGHTNGHLCLLFEKEKVLFLGDTIMNIFGKLSKRKSLLQP